jgi:quinolinate synthase
MTADNPGKAFLPALRPKICSNMKRTSLEDVRRALVNRQYQIDVPAQVADKARKALSEMLKYT